ncbi:GNAT family N-acetyltransferase [Rheinheimera sp. NSM]|uniref:GNAT family N-acetyltransferase n=1 Tax=Rheinheimera sp. NSM TaxID=3457884 RepID=UPI004036405F
MLRLATSDDFKLFEQLYSDERIMRFIGPVLQGKILQNMFASVIKSNCKAEAAQFYYTVLTLEDNQAVGVCAVSKLSVAQRCAEIGNMLLSGAQKRGYAEEATLALGQNLASQLGITRLTMNIDKRNIPAIRAAKKIGFERSAENVQHFYKILSLSC